MLFRSNEWSRATRLQKPVSLLLIDADSFKQHNDSYGHLSGDRCLKRIAQAAIEAAKRPEDLVARFGGDEFAVILPNTDEQGAQEVGGKIRAILNRRASDRKENPEGSFTISVGCGTVVPKMGDHPEDLIHIADQALYKAKRNGRDQLCMSFVPLPSLTPDA